MTEQTPKSDAIKRLIWPLRLTRAGMVAERGLRAFWPVWTLLFVVFAALSFGAGSLVSGTVLLGILAAIALITLGLVALGIRRFRMPTHTEALERLDATMPGRPITTLLDTPAVGGSDPASQSVWATHVARMANRASRARAPQPDLRISRHDPYALRYVGAVALAMALLFGGLSRVADVGEVSLGPGAATASAGPSWEGWVEPPLYTGLPSLYLNDITAERFEAPLGSEITLRAYGSPGDITLRTDVGPMPEFDENAYAQTVTMERAGTLAVDGPGGREWQVAVRPDQPPTVALEGEVEGEPPSAMQFRFSASDDYGIRSGTATIRLDADAADRRYGLTIDPEPREPVVLDLPMPFRGNRDEFSEVVLEDLSEHPFANLPVTLTLSVVDDAGQQASMTYDVARLPGQRFFDPLANALVEMRRDILWNRDNATRAARLLRAMTHRPEDDLDESVYRSLRAAIQRLEAAVDMISIETQEDVAEILWNAALELEFGDLDSALERLRRAQERLAEAMRQGASDEEIAELMQQMREAMDDYMQELADNTEFGDDTDQPDQGEQQEMSSADLDEMLRRIEELMQEGRMAEAMEMLQALQEMLENMEITQGDGTGDGPQTPGQEAMEGLQDTLRGQQELSDDAFQDLQEQLNPNRPGQRSEQDGNAPQGNQPGERGQDPGAGGQGGENGQTPPGTLAERQQELLRQLQEQAGRLPGTGTEAGDEALEQLDGAGRAMDEAADALERGDIADALDLQSEAMEALREGMTQLGEALAQEQGAEPGQGQAEGNRAEARPLQDPLGRQAGNNGAFGSDEEGLGDTEDARQRARELLDLLRDRAAEQTRPELERDYLRRLLDQF
ncbi:DUF4175 domain-containing protein [Gymnodinialimonas ceratoperidinii]|uniref:DUF4175 domain-containing protein n=1 Tax=Gymnodinialimonas ceratoperidinii TaxID=2856823 RepID=A0A8F6TWI7_9RHOB|nr:DUF4175 domain-containing protein [Gymnodinialimonas ceratoperidinii]QXT39748.1 DUF4175 domain-containing protein [Gymnodinialimonas ceratoperidinii]